MNFCGLNGRSRHPHGAKYARALNQWLQQYGFDSMPYGLRAACLKMIDHLDEIMQWRGSLPEAERASWNHPETIMRHWRAALRPKREAPHKTQNDKRAKGVRVFWPQDFVKRAADGLRQCRSNDLYTMARACLEAAIRDDVDLVAVLEQPKPTVRRTKPMLAAMALAV